MHKASSIASSRAAPLQRLAMFTSGLTLVTAMAVLAWAMLVART